MKKPPRKPSRGRRQQATATAGQATRAPTLAAAQAVSPLSGRTALEVPAPGAQAVEAAASSFAVVTPKRAAAPPSTNGSSPVYGRLDRIAVCLVLAPLLAAVGLSAANREGSAERAELERAVLTLATVSHEPPAVAAVSEPLPTATTAAPSDVQTLTSVALDPISIDSAPQSSIEPGEAGSDLIPAIAEETGAFAGRERRCEIDDSAAAPGALALGSAMRSDATWQEFGNALSDASSRQTRDFVVYADRYRDLKFPLGDVSALFGVCTDVVIRAYRAIGVDLQALVHKARVGSGDASIDHRRVEVLRRFFAANGESLAPSDLADDFLPGDVVTYHRPQNTSSQSHIAIVSNVIGFSGRPLIVHNRGWGPQLEDALFVDRMTGHYRYKGPGATLSSAPPIKNTRLRWLRRKAAQNASPPGAKPFAARSEAIRPHLKRASEAKASGRPKS